MKTAAELFRPLTVSDAVGGVLPIGNDGALDREDLVDAAHCFAGERQFAKIGQLEEFPPARRLGDRTVELTPLTRTPTG